MGFNHSKCYTMRVTHKINSLVNCYTMGENILQEVYHYPCLGVELASDLSWNKHIAQATLKANRVLGLLKRNLSTCDRNTKEVAYKALVRPLLEYCQAVWDPHQSNTISDIERLQRRTARFVLNDYNRQSSVTAMLDRLEWEPLWLRRAKARLCTFYREINGLIPCNIAHLIGAASEHAQHLHY